MVGRCAGAQGLGGEYDGGEVNTEHERIYIQIHTYIYMVPSSGRLPPPPHGMVQVGV